jgi:hypothetical protein
MIYLVFAAMAFMFAIFGFAGVLGPIAKRGWFQIENPLIQGLVLIAWGARSCISISTPKIES